MNARVERLTPSDATRIREAAHVVGWGLAIYTAVVLVGAHLKANATGAVAVQAVIVELGAGRLAISWSDPRGPLPTFATIARRAGRGAALGAAAVGAALVFAVATHAASFARSAPAAGPLAIGLLIAGLTATRDELLLRGLVLRAFERAAPGPFPIVIAGMAGAAATAGAALARAGSDVEVAVVPTLTAGLLAAAFAGLWRIDRGAWLAWGAHVAWLWVLGPVTHGALVDLRWAESVWGGGDALDSPVTTLVTAACAVAALVFAQRKTTKDARREPSGGG
jgi:hypothetical protein